MAKRVIFSKIYSDGIERKTEKDCNTETEMRKCFDECVVSFEEFRSSARSSVHLTDGIILWQVERQWELFLP